jgi:hypothetical protein
MSRCDCGLCAPSTERDQAAAADPVAAWGTFTAAVAARLEQGRAVYGDRSFAREPAALAGEIAEELLDVCAWSFILWTRLDRIRAAVAA